MTYWFLTSGNSQRDYSTFFEASTKCYPPPGGIASVALNRNATVCHQNTKHSVASHFIVVHDTHKYPLPWHTSRNWLTRVRYSSCSANLISEMARGERGSCRVAGSRRATVTSSSTTIPSTAHRSADSLAGSRGIGELSSGGRQPESSHPRNCRGIIINYGRPAPAPTVCIACDV